MEPLKNDFTMTQELYDKLLQIELPELDLILLDDQSSKKEKEKAEKRLKEIYDKYSEYLPEGTFEVDEKGNLVF